MIYGSVCSGIEAASAAWHPLGWNAEFLSEIEAFPNAVLKHRWPKIPNLGDMTKFKEWNHGPIELLVGGTPCQAFSVAGLRKGLADPRGNLALTFLAILNRARPRWVVWENVPGVLSSWSDAEDSFIPDESRSEDQGFQTNDFDTFTCGLRELGYGLAWRVLDAQYFGVPQRRRRVFVVGYLGDWRRAAGVLFEHHSLSWDPAPSRTPGKGTPHNPGKCLEARGGSGRADPTAETYITHSLKADGFDASEDGTGRGTPIIPIQGATGGDKGQNGIGVGEQGDAMFTITGRDQHAIYDMRGNGDGNISPTLSRSAAGDRPSDYAPVIAFGSKDSGADAITDVSPTLRSGGHDKSHANSGVPPAVALQWASGGGQLENPTAQAFRAGAEHNYQFLRRGTAVRRLTPRECERLQGFPDDYTLVPYRGRAAADGPRYKSIGNSMAVPVMAWIGRRIALVDAMR